MIMIKKITILIVIISFSLTNITYAISNKLNKAEKLYLEEDYKGAATECDRVLSRLKSGSLVYDAAYLAGLSYMQLKEHKKAREYLDFVYSNTKDESLKNEVAQAIKGLPKKTVSTKEPTLFSIQVGSFKNWNNAKKLYRKFKKKRYTVRIVKDTGSKGIVYKIKIGRFKSRLEAKRFAAKLKTQGSETSIVAY